MGRMQQILKERFGFESFRPGQEQLVEAIAPGRDCLGDRKSVV